MKLMSHARANPAAGTGVISKAVYDTIARAQWVLTLVAILAAIISSLTVSVVPTFSMYPTLNRGAYCLSTRNVEHLSRGDIVNFFPHATASPLPGALGAVADARSGNEIYVKRLVALPGDTVGVHGGRLYVNGVSVEEDYLNERSINYEMDDILLGEDEYFMMGDNRNHSGDSHILGPIRKDQLYSKVLVFFSPGISWDSGSA